MKINQRNAYFVEDFQVFGERYGIDHRFQLKEAQVSGSPVLQGNVEEMMLVRHFADPFRRTCITAP